MWQAAAISSPPPTTAPCSTATTGALPNSMRPKARCQLRECAMPCAMSREVSSPRSRPAQKCSPSPASTTALMASGSAAKNASMPDTVGSSMALRFSARARKSTAMSPRRSALSERGSCTSKPPADLLTAIPAALKSRVRSVTFLRKPVKRSHHLVDVEPDCELLARAGSERQNPVEPGQCRVGGLERVARLEIGDPVRPHDLPIRTGQNAALKPRPLHSAAEDVDHAAFAIGRRAEMPDVGELGVDGEDRCLRDHDHRAVLAAHRGPAAAQPRYLTVPRMTPK